MKKPTKRVQPVQKTARAAAAAAAPKREAEKVTAPAAAVVPRQGETFAKAAELFHAGRFAEARKLFEAAAEGPSPAMAHSARVHVRMCDQRLGKAAPVLASADDHYNYAVTLMNRRDFQAARPHLEEALRITGDGDHLHYLLAVCLGWQGDLDGACRHLKRAIEIHPRNRAIARTDPDFAELVHRPGIHELLTAGKAGMG
jgi:tetratricopeptide (TPR) repeat protein